MKYFRPAAAAVSSFILLIFFGAGWLALILALAGTIKNLLPAMTAGDYASLILGVFFIPMLVYLVQALFYLPRRSNGPAVFIRAQLTSLPLAFLPLPARKKLETGPTLNVVATIADRDRLMDKAAARLACFGLSGRLALLLETRSPLDIILKYLINNTPRPLSTLARLIYLLTGPARQFMLLWGFCALQIWRKLADPGEVDEFTAYKRILAFDLAHRLEHISRESNTKDINSRALWLALRRARNNPEYGQKTGETDQPSDEETAMAEAFYNDPWLAPRYYGLYLDLPVALSARSPEELYDNGPAEDPALFYPPELGAEIERQAEIAAESRWLKSILIDHDGEGIIWLDGRPVPAWTLKSRIYDLDDDAAALADRLAGHNRRCRSSHMVEARRLGHGWPERLHSLLCLVHFTERGKKILNLAEDDYSAAFFADSNLAEAAALDSLIRKSRHDLENLALTPELDFRGQEWKNFTELPDFQPTNPAPWLDKQAEARRELNSIFTSLKQQALTELLLAENYIDAQWCPSKPIIEVVSASPAFEPAPVTAMPLPEPAIPERVYSAAEKLGSSFMVTLLAALMVALLLWKAQTVGQSHLVVYNGLGRAVTVSCEEKTLNIGPYGHGLMPLWPNRSHHITTTIDGLLLESFDQQFQPVPATEIYNVAGAAPLMQWFSPRNEDSGDTMFLGRPRWLVTEAEVIFKAPPTKSEKRVSVLSGYGEIAPEDMLAAFDDGNDRDELIRLHARWDLPGTPWFWTWQALMAGRPGQAALLLERLKNEPDFLDRALNRLYLSGK